jgi:hypothetical protein
MTTDKLYAANTLVEPLARPQSHERYPEANYSTVATPSDLQGVAVEREPAARDRPVAAELKSPAVPSVSLQHIMGCWQVGSATVRAGATFWKSSSGICVTVNAYLHADSIFSASTLSSIAGGS